MAFLNRIRLPLYLKTPQFPVEANRFRMSDGTSKTLSVTIRKNYSLVTDYMGELSHQRLVIALNHDNVSIEGDRYVGGVSVDGEYEIGWPDFLDYPIAPASVKIQVTPFDFTNSNCQTCEEASQLSLVDDDIGEIDEGGEATVNVYLNDTICCYPPLTEIVSFNAGYLDSATIDSATGIATLTAKNPVASVGNIVLATYRVTCPDGSYDEADIYGSISGSEPECEQPASFEVAFTATPPTFMADIEWATPTPPALGYEWQLYETQTPGVPVQTGTSADNTVNITGLTPGTDYGFYVRSICAEGVYSPYGETLFTTPAGSTETCGTFLVACDDGGVDPDVYFYSFMDCDGNIQNRAITNLTSRFECMLMDAFNTPIYFQAHADGITILYDSLC